MPVAVTRRSAQPTPARSAAPRLARAFPHLLLAAAVFLFFREILLGRAFLWEDVMYQYYPFTFHLLRSLRSFVLPLWNSYMFGGMPFLADIQTQVFYPLNWFLVPLFTPVQSHVFWLVEFKTVLHILIGAVSCCLLMRDQKLSVWSGLVAGLTFGLGGFMVSHLIHVTIVSTFAWFPLILLFFLRVLRRGAVQDAAAGALVLGVANLAGHPQMSLHMGYALGVLFVLYLLLNWRNERRFVVRRLLPLFILLGGGGVALAAAAYIPAWRLSGHTVRELLTYAESAEISLPPQAALTLLVPRFFGSLTGAGTDSIGYWGGPTSHFYWETCLYVGIAPLLLALYALVAGRNRLRWPFAILAGIALLLALGRHTPLYRLVFEFLPGFDRFRIPARFVGLFGVSAAFLAGLGTEALVNPDPKRPARPGFPKFLLVLAGLAVALWVLLALGAFSRLLPGLGRPEAHANALRQTGAFLGLLAVTLLLFRLRPVPPAPRPSRFGLRSLVAPLLVLLTFADLYWSGHSFAPGPVSPERFYPRSPLVARLEAEKAAGPFRVNARQGSQMLLQRNEGLLWELELLEGYTPLRLADFAGFDIPLGRRNDLLNVTHRIAIDSARGRLKMLANPSALPRAWLADSCAVIPDRQQVLELLSDTLFDYRRVVILEKEPAPRPQTGPDSTPAGGVQIIQRSSDRLELKASCSRPSLLVLSEMFYPEWQARVDGRPAEILRADYCLRCVALPAGTHTVVLSYDRGPVLLGIVVSALTALGLGMTVVLTRRRRPGTR